MLTSEKFGCFFIGSCKNCNFPVLITRTGSCYEQVGSSTILCYEQEGPCWKAGLISVHPVAGMVHSKRAGRENLYIQTLRTRSISLPRNACGNGMDPPRAWLLGFFLLAEVLALSRVTLRSIYCYL